VLAGLILSLTHARRRGRLIEIVGVYRFDEGHIRRIISAAKSMLSLNAISRAGDGFPSSTDSFLHARIAAITPRVRLRPSSISFSIGISARICGKGTEL